MRNLTQTAILLSFSIVALLWEPSLSFAHQGTDKSEPAKVIAIRWHVAHGPGEVVGAGIKEFQRALASRGLTKFQVTTNDYSFQNREVTTAANLNSFNAIRRGDFEMGQIYSNVIGLENLEFTLFDRPYFIRDYAHAESIFDGEQGTLLLSSLDKQGLVGGAFTYSGGMRILYFTKNVEIKEPGDLKNLRLFVMGGRSNSPSQGFFQSVGFKPMKVNKELVGDSITDGKVDGFEAIYASAWIEKLSKKLNLKVYETNHSLHSSVIVFNKKFMDGLAKEEQMALLDAAKLAAIAERKASKAYAESIKNRLIGAGIVIRSLPPEVEKFMRNKADRPKRLADL
jgi:TRAP-type C4-dicarboxylate transport system substrate-binding protein